MSRSMIKFYCHQCSGKIAVDAAQAGQKATCPACGALCRVPGGHRSILPAAGEEPVIASLEAAPTARLPAGESSPLDPDATVVEEAYTGPVPGESLVEEDPIDWQLIEQNTRSEAAGGGDRARSPLSDASYAQQADPLAGLGLALGLDPGDLRLVPRRRTAWYRNRRLHGALVATLLLMPVIYGIAHWLTAPRRALVLAEAQEPIEARLIELLQQAPQGDSLFRVESLTTTFRGWPVGVPEDLRFTARILQQEASRSRQAGVITGSFTHRQGVIHQLGGRITFDAPGRYEELAVSDQLEKEWELARQQAEAQRLAAEEEARLQEARRLAELAKEEARRLRLKQEAARLATLQEAVYQYAGATLPLMRDIQQTLARHQAGSVRPASDIADLELPQNADRWLHLGTYQLQILLGALSQAPPFYTQALDQAAEELAGELHRLEEAVRRERAARSFPALERNTGNVPGLPARDESEDLLTCQRATTQAFLALLLIAEQIDQACEALGPYRPTAPTNEQALRWRTYRLHLLRAEAALFRRLLQPQRFRILARHQQAQSDLAHLTRSRPSLDLAAASYRQRLLNERRLRRTQLETQRDEALHRLAELDLLERRLREPLLLQAHHLSEMDAGDLRRMMLAERREIRQIAGEKSVDLLAPGASAPAIRHAEAEPTAATPAPRRLRPLWPGIGNAANSE